MKFLRVLLGASIVFAPVKVLALAPPVYDERIAWEEKLKDAGLYFLPHRLNYIMPMSFNRQPNTAVYAPDTVHLDEVETKFQFSIKIPLIEHLFNTDVQALVAYTQVSYWQTYNNEESSLFRATDYEPEFFLQLPTRFSMGPVANRNYRLGYAHQSNGQTDSLSRSWNRLYAETFFDYGPVVLSIKPWLRLKGDPDQDSNPDIWKYYGYGELRGAVKLRWRNEASFMWRNNLQTHDNKGAIELGWSFPLLRSMKGYVQYFNGYGESLLDYNHPVSRTSVGVSFSDWLSAPPTSGNRN